MKIAVVHNHYDVEHLAAVTREMTVRGAPKIRAVWMECYGIWAALEGCHRIRAAAELGLTPEIEAVDYSDDMCSTIIGYDGDEDYAISDVCDESYKKQQFDF